ncbi:hypothetical protein EMCRGX_G021003 [Ephydatia muelleri]
MKRLDFSKLFLWSWALANLSIAHDGHAVSRMLLQREGVCWGYERNCAKDQRLFVPHCDEPPSPWVNTMQEKHELFWNQGDFGYVKEVVDTLQLLCIPRDADDSSLECSSHTKFCKTRNLYLDFRRFKAMSQSPGVYKSFLENIFHPGEVGGHCQFNAAAHRSLGDHKSPLQSWFAELEQYTPLDFKPNTKHHCDVIVTKPTFFIKLDSGFNMYHHFCDFFNLYASQHANGSFNDDVIIVNWDTSYSNYGDMFSETWQAFSRYPLQKLSDFEGKRVCFRDVVFPLLARMRGGLYYNTYLVPGCSGSGLMQAFSKHTLQRLRVAQESSSSNVLRVTLLSRSTQHRRIVNEDQLVRAMKTVGYFQVKVVDYKYSKFPFLDQLKTTHNSDIFIGMHGAGLAHIMFLPDWAGVFEIFNTEDPGCYHDLARLRGVHYITWEDRKKLFEDAPGVHPTMGTAHAKFTNYSFDVPEFMRLVTVLGDIVLKRKQEYFSRGAPDSIAKTEL